MISWHGYLLWPVNLSIPLMLLSLLVFYVLQVALSLIGETVIAVAGHA
jgi:hypothetical protein